MAMEDYDAAIDVLTLLGADAKTLKVKHLMQWIRGRKTESERRLRLKLEITRATDLIREGRLEAALTCLQFLVLEFPDNDEVLHLHLRTRNELLAEQQAHQIEIIVGEATLFAQAGDFGAALRVIEGGLRRHPGDMSLLGLQAEWERVSAIRKTIEHCESLRAQRRYDEAIQSANTALKDYTGNPQLLDLLEILEQAREIDRRTSIEKVISEGLTYLDQNLPERVVALVQEQLNHYPGAPELGELLAQAERAQAAVVDSLNCKVIACIDMLDFDSALELIELGQERFPNEVRFLQSLAALQKAKASWLRQQAISEIVRRTEKCLYEKRFAEAVQFLVDAAEQYGDEAALQEARQKVERAQKVAQTVAGCKLLIDQGRSVRAIDLLTAFLAHSPAEGEINALLDDVRQRLAAREQADDVARTLKKACGQAALRNYDDAILVLEKGLDRWPGEVSLADSLALIRDEGASWEGEKAVRELIQKAEQLAERGSFEESLSLIRGSLGHHPGNTALSDLQVRVERDAEQKKQSAAIAEASATVKALLDDGKIDDALRRLDDISSRFPHEGVIESLLARVNREKATRQRRDQVVRQADALVEQGRLEEAVGFLRNARTQFSDSEVIDPVLDRIENELLPRQRAMAIEKTVGEVRVLLGAQDFDRALARLDQSLESWPREESLVRLAEVAKAARKSWEREHAFNDRIRSIESLAQLDRPTEWRESIESALAEFPAEPRLLELQAQFRFRQDLVTARGLLENASPREALQFLKELLQTHPADADLAALVDHGNELLREQEHAAAIETVVIKACSWSAGTDFDGALAILEEALKQWPNERALIDAWRTTSDARTSWQHQQEVADRETDAAVNGCLSKVEKLLEAGDLKAALAELERTLISHADESRLKSTRDALAAEISVRRTVLLAELKHMSEAAKETIEIGPLEAIAEHAQRVAASDSDPEVKLLAESTTRNLRRRIRRLRIKRSWSNLLSHRNRFAVIAGGLVLAIAADLSIRTLKTSVTIPLQVMSTPAGATIETGGKVCSAPQCEFELKSGKYSIEAWLDGYERVTRSVALDAAHHSPIVLELQPLRATVEVSTNFTSGQVLLDGREAGVLKSGLFSTPPLPFGKHEIIVSGREGQATVVFETAAGQLPIPRGGVGARNVEVAVAGNLGNTIRLDCNNCNDPVTIDGKPAGKVTAGGLYLRNLVQGTKEVKLGKRSFFVTVRPEPTLRIIVNANRNVGWILVETPNVDGATVLINGKQAGQINGGAFHALLDASDRSYVVRVEKAGFRIEPSQLPVQIRKGEESRAAFRLEASPLPGQDGKLTITGAVPGTEVFVDGRSVGIVAADGNLSLNIVVGVHDIDLRKDGFLPRRFSKSVLVGSSITLAKPDSELAAVSLPTPVVVPQPGTPPAASPDLEMQDWNQIKDSKDIIQFEAFIKNHPDSPHGEEAERKMEEMNWQSLTKDEVGLKGFLSRHPSGAHVADARSLLAGLEKAQDEQSRLEAEKRSVLALLQKYSEAYNNRDANAVRRIYPGVPLATVRNAFKDARSYELKLTPEEPKLRNNTASVRCQRVVTLTTTFGHTLPTNDKIVIQLRKDSGQWLIESVNKE